MPEFPQRACRAVSEQRYGTSDPARLAFHDGAAWGWNSRGRHPDADPTIPGSLAHQLARARKQRDAWSDEAWRLRAENAALKGGLDYIGSVLSDVASAIERGDEAALASAIEDIARKTAALTTPTGPAVAGPEERSSD